MITALALCNNVTPVLEKNDKENKEENELKSV
jgi:hypothetical protein